MTYQDLPLGKAIHITWVDSVTTMGWQKPKGRALGEIHSLGYVTGTSPDALGISTSLGDIGVVLGPIHIPWGAITSLEPLGIEHDQVDALTHENR